MIYRNNVLLNSNCTTNGTVLTRGKTGVVAIGSYCCIDHFSVTCCRNFNLSNNSLTATIAVASLGKTGCCTCRSYCRIGYDSVTQRFAKLYSTNGTVTCLCTSSTFRKSVSVLRNFFLRNCYSTTNRTVLTFCKTGFCTCGGYCFIDYFSMTELRYSFLSNYHSTTNRTMLTFGKTGCCTCGSYCFINYFSVTECINVRIYVAVTTTRTFVSSITLFNTSRSCYSFNILVSESCTKSNATYFTVTCLSTVCTFRQAMAVCRNYLLCNCYSTTNRTVLTFGKTGICTCRSYRVIDYFGMSGNRNYLLCNGYSTTNRTVLTFGKTGCCTCRSYCIINYLSMSRSSDLLCYACTTRTEYLFQTNVGTSRCLNNFISTFGVVSNFPTVLSRTKERNLHISGTLNQLMSYFLSTMGNLNSTVTGNISTTGCNINITS